MNRKQYIAAAVILMFMVITLCACSPRRQQQTQSDEYRARCLAVGGQYVALLNDDGTVNHHRCYIVDGGKK